MGSVSDPIHLDTLEKYDEIKAAATTRRNASIQQEARYNPRERFVIFRNVVFIGIAFMIHFTAFHGTVNLQSSLNSDASLGTTTLAVMYGSLILSNIFLPMTVIRWFGCRMTMALGLFTYMPYIAAQYYPSFYTLIPAAFLVGFGAGPLLCAKCTYLSTVAGALTNVRGRESRKDVNTVKFFSIFFIFYHLSQVWGNLISSSILNLSVDDGIDDHDMIAEIDDDDDDIYYNNDNGKHLTTVGKLCGARFCPEISMSRLSNLTPPDPRNIKLLTTVFLLCMFVATFVIMCCVNSLERYGVSRRETSNGLSGFKLLTATLNLLRKRRQILLFPITLFIGMEEAFLAADFTKSFVACGWGISNIGFAMICFGIGNAIAALVSGIMVGKIGRGCVAIVCGCINVGLFIGMQIYVARENDFIFYCALASIWGICDGIWLVVVNALYGILFPKDLIAAYSNFRLWQVAGLVIGYIISQLLCTSTKLSVLLAVLLVGCTGYGLSEYEYWKKRRNDEVELSD